MDSEFHVSPEEAELIQKFRQLSFEGRQFILCTTKDAHLLFPKIVRQSNVIQLVTALAV